MKVLRVINSLGLGGAERSLDTNVPVHISHGLDMDILVLNGERTPFYENLESKGVKIINSYNCSIYNPIHIIKLIKLLREYDIVHAHLFPSFYWVVLAKLLSFNHKTKLVFTEHSTSNRRMQNHFFKPFDLFIYRFYDIIISISEATTRNLNGYLGEGEKIITIPNGVDLRPYQIECTKQPLFDSNDDVVIVTQVAGFRIEKDQDTVIRALSLLPDNIHLVFAGDGERINECKSLSESLGLSQRVHYLGFCRDIPTIVLNSDIIVMSSHIEGFGRAAVEGMAAKKPVIASDVPGLADVVRGAGLLFPVRDYKALADRILSLASDKELYDNISSACYKRSLEYSSDKMINGYEEVYYSLIENN